MEILVLRSLEFLGFCWGSGGRGWEGPAQGQKGGPDHGKPAVRRAGGLAVLGEGRQQKTGLPVLSGAHSPEKRRGSRCFRECPCPPCCGGRSAV